VAIIMFVKVELIDRGSGGVELNVGIRTRINSVSITRPADETMNMNTMRVKKAI